MPPCITLGPRGAEDNDHQAWTSTSLQTNLDTISVGGQTRVNSKSLGGNVLSKF